MVIRIEKSGSAGNCVLINEEIMIDAGAKTYAPGVWSVLLTHKHVDHTKHINEINYLPIFVSEDVFGSVSAPNWPFLHEISRFGSWISDDPDECVKTAYKVTPVRLKHDVSCTGYDIIWGSERILYATDFCEIVDDLDLSKYDAIFIECNNSLRPGDLVETMFADKPLRDSFHRKRSWNNHANAGYLIDYFASHNYTGAPVVLLHKSKTYYAYNPDDIERLCNAINVVNPEPVNLLNVTFDTIKQTFI